MPIQLADLVAKRVKTITVDLGGDTLTLGYSPDALTKTMLAEVEAGTIEKDPFKVAEAVIVPMVKTWDLEDGKKPYPIDVEHVAALGLPICNAIMGALFADVNEPPDTKGGSGGG